MPIPPYRSYYHITYPWWVRRLRRVVAWLEFHTERRERMDEVER